MRIYKNERLRVGVHEGRKWVTNAHWAVCEGPKTPKCLKEFFDKPEGTYTCEGGKWKKTSDYKPSPEELFKDQSDAKELTPLMLDEAQVAVKWVTTFFLAYDGGKFMSLVSENEAEILKLGDTHKATNSGSPMLIIKNGVIVAALSSVVREEGEEILPPLRNEEVNADTAIKNFNQELKKHYMDTLEPDFKKKLRSFHKKDLKDEIIKEYNDELGGKFSGGNRRKRRIN